MTVKRFIARPASHSRYESLLARLAKFAYLNRLDHRDIDVLLTDSALSQRVPKATTKSVAISLMLQADAQGAKIAARLAEMLEINQDDVPRMLTKTFCIWGHEDERKHRHCPECDKTGFHSAIFDLPCLMQCPIHGVDLTDECPVCEEYSNRDCSVTRPDAPFECRKGHVLWPNRNSRTWPKCVTPKQEDVLDDVMSFLEVTRDLVHFTKSCLFPPLNQAVQLPPNIAVPLAAKVIPAGRKYLKRFNIDPMSISQIRLWPDPPNDGASLSGETIGEIVEYVKLGEPNLSDVACRDVARLMFDRIEVEIEAAIKMTHGFCTEFTKFLPPHTDLRQWVRWCPALSAKYRWHIHWGLGADWHDLGYPQETRLYWEDFRIIMQSLRFDSLFIPEIRKQMTDNEAVNIFLATANAMYVPGLRKTYMEALSAATPEQRVDGIFIERRHPAMDHSPYPHILLVKNRNTEEIELVWGTMLYGHRDIESAIVNSGHSLDTTKIIRDAVNSLWEQYENARRDPDELTRHRSTRATRE